MAHSQGHHHRQCQTKAGSHPYQATEVVAFKNKVVIEGPLIRFRSRIVAAFLRGLAMLSQGEDSSAHLVQIDTHNAPVVPSLATGLPKASFAPLAFKPACGSIVA